MSTIELVNRGMKCLREGLGDIDTEEFIAIIMRERFDYTKWQRTLFDDMTLDELTDSAIAYEEEHPFHAGVPQ